MKGFDSIEFNNALILKMLDDIKNIIEENNETLQETHIILQKTNEELKAKLIKEREGKK